MAIGAISDSVERGFDRFFDWLPHLAGALVVLVVGYLVARLVSRLVWRGLQRAGLDRTLVTGPGGRWFARLTTSPSRLLGTLAFWAILLSTASLAVSVLGIDALEDFVAAVWAYLPNVLAAIAIFVVAGLLATGLSALATRLMGDTALGRIVATGAPILVLTIATFMILDQLGIAETIVTITYAGLIGAIALGAALAFGLGGRDVAGRMLEGAYVAGQERKAEFRRDFETGLARARAERERALDETPVDDWRPAESDSLEEEEELSERETTIFDAAPREPRG